MEYKDYYKTLGLKKTASADDIKRAYRKLARKYHPDVSKEANAEERFKEVQEAYEVLKDAKKREAYDQLGSHWKSGQDFRPPPDWGGFSGFQQADFGEENLGGFSDFFEAIFGAGRGRASSARIRTRHPFPQAGQDQTARIDISLEDAFRGASKMIHLQVPEMNGQGRMHHATRSLKVNIPAGVVSGQQLRLAKQGAPGMGSGPPGDLFLEIHIQPHRIFTLQGSDVYLTLPITPWEAALGAKVLVPTLAGSVDMKILPDSQSGQKLRLKGRGLPIKPAVGDQYVVLQIVTPPAKTEAARAFYQKMAEEMPFNPRNHFA